MSNSHNGGAGADRGHRPPSGENGLGTCCNGLLQDAAAGAESRFFPGLVTGVFQEEVDHLQQLRSASVFWVAGDGLLKTANRLILAEDPDVGPPQIFPDRGCLRNEFREAFEETRRLET